MICTKSVSGPLSVIEDPLGVTTAARKITRPILWGKASRNCKQLKPPKLWPTNTTCTTHQSTKTLIIST
jgi:hypothetical protein